MRLSAKIALCLAVAAPMPAVAAPVLLAVGTLTGTQDASGLTGTMENGLPANILGGTGSGFAYAGGNTYLALPDRGPNATPYAGGAAVDNTTTYISRFNTLTMQLVANPSGSTLPFSLTPVLDSTTLLYSETPLNYGDGVANGLGSGAPAQNDATHYYFSGRSDNYAAGANSSDPLSARLDPESIRVDNGGNSVFISDEYGPYIRQFDRSTGKLIRTYTLPANLTAAVSKPVETGPQGEIASNTSGRTTNKGMEGLAITPDGKTLVGIMQAALIQDAPTASKLLRIVTVDVATGETHEYAYKLNGGSGVSDIVAINDHQFLVDERDGKGLGDGSNASIKQLYLIDISGAHDITNLTGNQVDANGKTALDYAVTKSASPFLDIVTALTGQPLGLTKAQVPAKIEGIAFGEDVTVNGELLHTLWVTNDNDYLPDVAGGNKFYVFGVSDRDLPSFLAQSVPEPSTWAMMIGGFALLGASLRRNSTSVRFA